jgi:hypothetical protein
MEFGDGGSLSSGVANRLVDVLIGVKSTIAGALNGAGDGLLDQI